MAEEQLRGTLSSDKNELLFSQFGINYNNEPALYRKGSIVMKKCKFMAENAEKASILKEAEQTIQGLQGEQQKYVYFPILFLSSIVS